MNDGRVAVTIDRPLGSAHPAYPELRYPVNYGFVPGMMAPDGEPQDAYVLGVEAPLAVGTFFCGRRVAIVRRRDDVEEKWVVCPEGYAPSREQIETQLRFVERFFDSVVEMLPPQPR